MVIDTSALVAMLSDEPDAERFEVAVEADHPADVDGVFTWKRHCDRSPLR